MQPNTARWNSIPQFDVGGGGLRCPSALVIIVIMIFIYF